MCSPFCKKFYPCSNPIHIHPILTNPRPQEISQLRGYLQIMSTSPFTVGILHFLPKLLALYCCHVFVLGLFFQNCTWTFPTINGNSRVSILKEANLFWWTNTIQVRTCSYWKDYSCSWSSAQCHFPSFPLPFTPPSQFISSLSLLHPPHPSPTLSFEAEGDRTGEVTVDPVKFTEVLDFRATSNCKEARSRKKKERGREGEKKMR